jgi:hypothetical protein
MGGLAGDPENLGDVSEGGAAAERPRDLGLLEGVQVLAQCGDGAQRRLRLLGVDRVLDEIAEVLAEVLDGSGIPAPPAGVSSG